MSQLQCNSIVPIGGIPAGANGGGIIQCVQTLKTNSFSATSTGNANWTDITGMSATITPRSTSNKILVMYTIYSSHSVNGNYGHNTRLLRGATPIGVGDLSGSIPQGTTACVNPYSSVTMPETQIILDSPATTSSTTYKVQFMSEGTTTTYYVNIPGSTSTLDGRSSTVVSHITLMEISG